MKRICLIIHSLGIGGMERVMATLANYFSSLDGVAVDLVLIGLKREVKYDLNDSINIHRPDFPFDNSKRTVHTFRTMRFIRQKVKSLQPDTVLSFGEFWNNLVLLSLLGINVPVYISDRSEPNKDLGRVQNLLRDVLYPKAAGYVAQTTQAGKIAEQNNWNENIQVIGNPIRSIPSNPDIEKENVVLFVGRLIKTKHVDQLINMFHEVRQLGWRLEVVGGDAKGLALSEEYQRLIEELGADEYISLEGEQSNVEDYYNKSKIFAFTSSSEGFPNVVGEALSAGLPVVAYDCIAGPSDMIEDGENGYLVPLFDEERFKIGLKTLMRNRDLRNKMGIEAKNSIKRFSDKIISERFFEFITKSA